MNWWQTAIVALASSAVGGFLTVAGSYVLARRQSTDRRRDEATHAAGAALAALREIDPEVWGDRLASYPDAPAIVSSKRDKWLAAAGGLDVLATWYSDPRVTALVEIIVDRARLVLIRLDDVASGATVNDPWRVAIPREYAKALNAARELAQLVRR